MTTALVPSPSKTMYPSLDSIVLCEVDLTSVSMDRANLQMQPSNCPANSYDFSLSLFCAPPSPKNNDVARSVWMAFLALARISVPDTCNSRSTNGNDHHPSI